MDGMVKHLYDRSLQTSGSACLYYVVDMFQNEDESVLEKYSDYLKRLLIIIVNAMNVHLQHSPVIKKTNKRNNFLANSFLLYLDDSKWTFDYFSYAIAFT